jgi:hypothetical protein
MRRKMPVHLFVVVALAIAATIGGLALAPPAGAASYTTCTSLTGLNLAGQPDTVAGCTGPTGGTGTFLGPLVSPTTINWAGGGTTSITFATKVPKNPKKSTCAVGSIEMKLRGHATSTDPAGRIRGMFFATVCVDPDEDLSLAPGKSVLLQFR